MGLWVLYVGGAGGLFGWAIAGSAGGGFVVDGSGGWGTYTVYGGGVTSGVGGSFGLSFGFMGSTDRGKTATTIEDFGGPFLNGSVGVGLGPSVSVDVFNDPNTPSNKDGGLTIGAGVGGEVGVQMTNTTVTPNTLSWRDFLPNGLGHPYGPRDAQPGGGMLGAD